MSDVSDYEVSVQQEIEDVSVGKPHVLLLGAGASKAALPYGDKNGKPVPILRELARDLYLHKDFPQELAELSQVDFEAAYSKLFSRGEGKELEQISKIIADYFFDLELPDEANLYDVINLSFRKKDIIATFNWDPFLIASQRRLAKLGVTKLPQLFFLHGNVVVGYCAQDKVSGLVGNKCSRCGNSFEPSKLLYPVENKNYQDGNFIQREWEAIGYYLKHCFMLTIFGYSAPKTDVEAVALLKEGWGDVEDRSMEQTEIINRPGADHEALRETWDEFIHTHHYEIHESFYDSFIAKHPRRTGEAYKNQYYDAKFISDNPIPKDISKLEQLVEWFVPLLDVERKS
jgi:hypothetical protein